MNREFDKRPWIRSLVHKTEGFPLDRTMHRSIMYNKVLFYTLRDYYSGYGWMMLIKYYLSFGYTLEKRIGMLKIDNNLMNSILDYIHKVELPYNEHELTEYDISMFELATKILLAYFGNINELNMALAEHRATKLKKAHATPDEIRKKHSEAIKKLYAKNPNKMLKWVGKGCKYVRGDDGKRHRIYT